MKTFASNSKSIPIQQQVFPQEIYCIIPSINNKGAIFISNIEVAQNPKTLKQHNIGAVITAIKGKNLSEIVPKHIQYLYIPAVDHQSFDISVFFKDSNQFINQQRERTNVLVHCMAGISRSVTLVIAYLMFKQKMNMKDAWNLVKKRRGMIHPNVSFIQQLNNYQRKLLEDKKQRSKSPQQRQNKQNKRQIMQVKNNNSHSYLDKKKECLHHNHYSDVSNILKATVNIQDNKINKNQYSNGSIKNKNSNLIYESSLSSPNNQMFKSSLSAFNRCYQQQTKYDQNLMSKIIKLINQKKNIAEDENNSFVRNNNNSSSILNNKILLLR